MPNPKSVDTDDIELLEIEQDDASDETLARATTRVFQFIEGVANNPPALLLLSARGYTEESHQEAWELLRAATPFTATVATKIVADPKVADAIRTLDAWDNEHFAIIEAALQRKFPAQRAALFRELSAQEGAASVDAVRALLERLAKLAKGKLTDDSAKDKAADALLVQRTYTHALREELAEAVKTAQSLPELSAVDPATSATKEQARRAALLALHGWWKEWATTARKAIKRRDLLVNLGLARRKKSEKKSEPSA